MKTKIKVKDRISELSTGDVLVLIRVRLQSVPALTLNNLVTRTDDAARSDDAEKQKEIATVVYDTVIEFEATTDFEKNIKDTILTLLNTILT